MAKCWIRVLFLSVIVHSFSFGQNATDSTFHSIMIDFFQETMETNPDWATSLGVSADMGVKLHNDRLSDVSVKHQDEQRDQQRRLLKSLKTLNLADLSRRNQILAKTVLWDLNHTLESEEFRFHDYIINPMFGDHPFLTNLMTVDHRLETVPDADNYIKRLEDYADRFAQVIRQIKVRQKQKLGPPRFIMDTAVQELTAFIRTRAEDNILVTSFISRLEENDQFHDAEKDRLKRKVINSVEKTVYPAYQKLIREISKVRKKARKEAGVWALPNGDKYYTYCLKNHTTTDLSAEQIHQIGRKEVARIHNHMKILFSSIGIDTTTSYRSMRRAYGQETWNDHRNEFYYPNSPKGRKRAIADYKLQIEDAWKRVPDLFTISTETPVDVQRVPHYLQNTMGAHYRSGSLDGKEGGVFFVNLGRTPFKPSMRTLAVHEAVPGHHFQIAIRQDQFRGVWYRNLFRYTGYIEGWALYAERLAYEQDWFRDTYEKLGYLESELLRAARLVLDTGIHHFRWTRNEAYESMEEMLGWASYRSIDRYSVWPGQACTYKIGELRILELRQQAMDCMGDQFDIREFHRIILQNGSVPFHILEEIVDQYIKQGAQS